MSGTAKARFTCGALSSISPSPTARCNNSIELDLTNDGQYDGFVTPDDWHIRLGTTADTTIVRCPSHCELVEYKEFRTFEWRDAP